LKYAKRWKAKAIHYRQLVENGEMSEITDKKSKDKDKLVDVEVVSDDDDENQKLGDKKSEESKDSKESKESKEELDEDDDKKDEKDDTKAEKDDEKVDEKDDEKDDKKDKDGDKDDDGEEESGSAKSEEPFSVTLTKSLAYMIVGLALVAIFSDPMVDVLTNFGAFLSIPPFYISFIITPMCSNASELIASIIFASKKTVVSSSMTYSQLYGAATMNATLGLGIFYTLIYARGLAWEFTAETLSILLVTWIVCGFSSFKKLYQTYWVIPNAMLYPLSLLFVWILEYFAHFK